MWLELGGFTTCSVRGEVTRKHSDADVGGEGGVSWPSTCGEATQPSVGKDTVEPFDPCKGVWLVIYHSAFQLLRRQFLSKNTLVKTETNQINIKWNAILHENAEDYF